MMSPFVKFVVVAMVLAFLLSPGVIITLPPTEDCGAFFNLADGENCATSYSAAFVHAIVLGAILFGLKQFKVLA